MNLPTKDKNGKSYLSYSAINSFLKDRQQFVKSYILKEPFVGNEYTDFGNKVGKALEVNDYSNFTEPEKTVLQSVTRLDLFEQKIILNYDSFYLIGYIDTCSSELTQIIDYKTGGKNKHLQYQFPDYNQMIYYALGIRQETGIQVKSASVEFIERSGNLKTGFSVSTNPVVKIPIDLSEGKLKQVYWETINIAKQIEIFYEDYLNSQK